MSRWISYRYQDKTGFGILESEEIIVHEGDMFNKPTVTSERIPLSEVGICIPCMPSKLLGLWNNFKQRAELEGWSKPLHPLYFCKSSNSYLPSNGIIIRPHNYSGDIVFEGELGIVIGKQCNNIQVSKSDEYIFGYTCVNDVTARDILKSDSSFTQWGRAKSFDTFGVFGPYISTDIDVSNLTVTSTLNGQIKQNYSVSDMFFSPQEIVSLISNDVTLFPGDVIACGTSIGAGAMPNNGDIEIRINDIGTLKNNVRF